MSKTKTPAAKVILGDGTLSKDEEERVALLMILHLADRNIAEGKTTPLAEVMKRVRARLRQRKTRKR
jgi:uracil-DNA glycosylase